MTMFAEPVLASAAEERMERMEGCRRGGEMENCRPRDYHHYPQHHDTPDHLREKNYHYSDNDDREVGNFELKVTKNLSIWQFRKSLKMKESLFAL